LFIPMPYPNTRTTLEYATEMNSRFPLNFDNKSLKLEVTSSIKDQDISVKAQRNHNKKHSAGTCKIRISNASCNMPSVSDFPSSKK